MELKKVLLLLFCLILANFLFSVNLGGINTDSICLNRDFPADISLITNKLDIRLQSLLISADNSTDSSIQVIIHFENKDLMASAISKLNSFSSRIKLIRDWTIIPAAVFTIPVKEILSVAHFPEIKKIWLDMRFYIDAFYENPSNLAQVSALSDSNDDKPIFTKNSGASTQLFNGSNVIVALLDTGVDIFHPDLNNSILAFGGVSFVEGDPYPLDFHGHGTFCAGVITGDGIIDQIRAGVAPGASILNIKVLSSQGFGLWSWIISGIEYAITHGADIISMCFSMPGYPGDPVNLAIDAATKRGMIVIAAVGDEGPAFSSISTPGMAQSAITVGAYDDFVQQPAVFSAKGPTLYFYSKPDILASGVNISSCRPTIPSNLPINLTEFLQAFPYYGTPLNAYYTTVNSTSAAAANVTGVVASLLQHSKYLSAEGAKVILQKSATPLSNIATNSQGAGLVNLQQAHNFLTQNNMNRTLTDSRLYNPTFFSPGYIISQNLTRSLTMLISTYGTILAITETQPNSTKTHLIQGQFAIKYDNHLKWLSDMYVLRESHNLTSEFSRIQSVLTDYSIICIITAETFASASGFRVNITLVNLEPHTLHNISIFSLWEPNVLFNQSAEVKNDIAIYNVSDDIISVFDSRNGNLSYLGFSGLISSTAHEINTSSCIRNQILGGQLLNNNQSIEKNIAIAMEWQLTEDLATQANLQFAECIGVADSYFSLNNSIQILKKAQSTYNLTNLALLSSNISRLGFVNQPYTCNVLLMNIGNVAINNTFIALIINSTDAQTQTFFSKYFNLGTLAPFEFRWINATWNPTEIDIYSLYWITGTEALINELIFYFMNFSRSILQEQFFLDNFFVRNIFIKDNTQELHSIFPKIIPMAPYLIYYPNDAAIFNISIITNHPLTNLEILVLEGNLPPDWISIRYPSLVQNHGSIQITLSIPSNPRIGDFYQRLNIRSEGTLIDTLWINFTVQHPSGRILFYKPSYNFISSDNLQIENILNLWNERLDNIYGGYFEFYTICAQNNYDVDDFGIMRQVNPNISLDTIIKLPFNIPYQISTLKQNISFISNYDLVVLCDPEVNLSNNEINTLIDFVNSGGSFFIWMEPDSECEPNSVNTILGHFGIQTLNSYNFTLNIPFLTPNLNEITKNLGSIKISSFITFSNYSILPHLAQYDNAATIILNNTRGKVLCMGDSSAFNDSLISAADNLRFLNQSLNWLLKEKINITIFINRPNESSPLRISQHLSISIHLTSLYGYELNNNLSILSYLITPSNRILYMVFFPTQAGWYNTIYFGQWLNETGTYFLVVYADNLSLVSSFSVQELILYPALPPSGEDPDLDRPWASWVQVSIGTLITLVLTGLFVGIFLFQRRQWRRQMTIVEMKEKLKREISNVLNEYHLYVKELEELLHKPQIIDSEKLHLILDKQERAKNLLNKLKNLGKNV